MYIDIMLNKNTLKKRFIFSLILFISLFCILSTVSAEDNVTNINNVHYIDSNLSNVEIQSVIDNSSEGDTLKFNDGDYNNISLIVDKKLTILGNNSNIYTLNIVTDKAKDMGLVNTFGFYFTPNSSGSSISGFNFISDSDYSIIVNGGSDICISNCTINGGNNGILIENSNNFKIINNTIKKTNNNGIYIKESKNGYVYQNYISNNKRSGILMSDAEKNVIESNVICVNSFNGISLYNTTTNNLFFHNEIYQNLNGIYISSKSSNDTIRYNTIYDNRMDPASELGNYETGNGILIGPEYVKTSKQPVIYYNSILSNENFGVKNSPTNPEKITIGANWYGSNSKSGTFVCPMILGALLKGQLFSVANGIGLKFFDGSKQVSDIGSPLVKVTVNGETSYEQVKNGQINKQLDPNKDNDVKMTSGRESWSKNIPKSVTNDESQTESSQTSSENGGSGEGSGSGSGEGNSAISGSSIKGNGTGSIGLSGQTITSDIAAESGADSGSKSNSEKAKSYELEEQKIAKQLTNNSPIIILSLLAVAIIFILGFKRKNKFE